MLLHSLKFFFIYFLTCSTIYASNTIYTSTDLLYSLLYGVSENCVEVKPIIEAGVSAHDFSLKPKQLENIVNNAKAVVYINSNYEHFITSLKARDSSARFISILNTPGLKLYYNDKEIDPHLLLSPYNAEQVIKYLSKELGDLYPHCQKDFAKNSEFMQDKLLQLEKNIKSKLTPLQNREKSFLVLHDGYQYFYKYFSLPQPAVINHGHSHHLSAKRLALLKKEIKAGKFACIIAENSESPELLASLEEKLKLPTLTVNTEAGEKNNSSPGFIYFYMLNSLANQIINCYQ